MLKDFLVEWKLKADATSNPWDDVLINFVLALMTEEVHWQLRPEWLSLKLTNPQPLSSGGILFVWGDFPGHTGLCSPVKI